MEASVASSSRRGSTAAHHARGEREIEPRLAIDDLIAACYEPEAGYADPVADDRGLRRRRARDGRGDHGGDEVAGLRTEGGRVARWRRATARSRRRVVVNAAGTWGARVGAMAGVEIPITVCRHKISSSHGRSDARGRTRWSTTSSPTSTRARRPAGTSWSARSTPRSSQDHADPDQYREGLSFDETTDALGRAATASRCSERAAVASGYAGCFDVTPTGTRSSTARARGLLGGGGLLGPRLQALARRRRHGGDARRRRQDAGGRRRTRSACRASPRASRSVAPTATG